MIVVKPPPRTARGTEPARVRGEIRAHADPPHGRPRPARPPRRVNEALSLVLLAVTLAVVLIRPRRVPDLAVAAGSAVLLIATGAISIDAVRDEAGDLGPTIGFLAGVLVIGAMAEREGLFRAAGHLLAVRSGGRPGRLLGLVVALSAGVTAILSLDATVVLLTPVVVATAGALGVRARPHLYACGHLSNSASLLLPVSNLTNLLAFRAADVSFARFGALMALPWLAAVAVEWAVLRALFADDLAGAATPPDDAPEGDGAPVFAAIAIGATLAGFLLGERLGLDPAVVAAAGALLLAIPVLLRNLAAPIDIVQAADVPFLAFVLALGIVVRAASDRGLGDAVGHLVPGGSSFLALLGIAAVAAFLANAVNNLPAILLVLPVLAPRGTGPVLAALIGVNIGPNLTYAGSLATLLWRRVLAGTPDEPRLREFTRAGLLTVPPAVVLATLALWLALCVSRGAA